MQKKTILAAAMLMLGATSGQANMIHLEGDLGFHNQVVHMNVSLNNDAENVRFWTDSFQDGVNFDPIIALWDSSGNQVFQNDDDLYDYESSYYGDGYYEGEDVSYINPETQTYFDSGYELSELEAGSYTMTLTAYANFSNSNMLEDGFENDGMEPMTLEEWCQPASYCGMGSEWSLWVDGMDDAGIVTFDVESSAGSAGAGGASASVPEPATWTLLGLGLFAIGFLRKKAS